MKRIHVFQKHTVSWISSSLLSIVICTSLFVSAQVVKAKETVVSLGNTLSLNGVTVRQQLRNDFYIAALYAQTTSSDPTVLLSQTNAKRMDIRLSADRVSATRFGRMWVEAIRINNDTATIQKNQSSILKFMDLFSLPVVAGDQVIFDYAKGQGVEVTMNSVSLGTIKNDEFMALLVKTWLGPRPPSEPFKNAILGLTPESKSSELVSQLSSKPSSARVTQVKKELAEVKKVNSPKPSTTAKTTRKPPAPKPRKDTKAQEAAKKKAQQERQQKRAMQKQIDDAVKKAVEKERKAAAIKLKQQMESLKAEQQQQSASQQNVQSASNEKLDGFLARKEYQQSLITYVTKRIAYPPTAFKKGIEGKGVLRIKLYRDGQVSEVQIDKSTKSRLLDREAVKAIKQLSPLPAVPEDIPGMEFEFLAPVNFKR